MSKRFLKNIAIASSISLTLLGATETAWGMWEELDENSRAIISTQHLMICEQELKATERIEVYSTIIKRIKTGEDYYPNVSILELCPFCKRAGEQSLAVQKMLKQQIFLETSIIDSERATQGIHLTMQAVNERIQSLENESRTAQNVILQTKNANRKSVEDEKEINNFKELEEDNIGSLGTTLITHGMWDDDPSFEKLYARAKIHQIHCLLKSPSTPESVQENAVFDNFLTKNPDGTRQLQVKIFLSRCNDCLSLLKEMKTSGKLMEEKEKKHQRKEESQKHNLILPIEESGSLFSTVKSLRQTKLQHEGIIKNLNEEAEESTEIIKKMMKIIGIKTDDFSDCTGNIFAKKCLDRLNHEMGSL